MGKNSSFIREVREAECVFHCLYIFIKYLCSIFIVYVVVFLRYSCTVGYNPLVASVAFSILLWLTPDDFTRQWETSWPPQG